MGAQVYYIVTLNITIIDTQSANISSLRNALSVLGFDTNVSKDPGEIEKSSHIILPGVGAFDTCVRAVDDANLRNVILEQTIEQKTPFLGICVGMQLLFEGSEEGRSPGLGIIEGNCVGLETDSNKKFKVPHNGFAEVSFSAKTILNQGLRAKEYFYFNHSYAAQNIKKTDAVDYSNHSKKFVSSFQYGNIFGVQFHPEKSQKAGLKLLSNFINLNSV